jgi:putative oxidoreductase
MSDDLFKNHRFVFPALAPLYDRFSPYSYALMRFSAGAVLFPHGWVKLFHGDTAKAAEGIAAHGWPFPLFFAWAVVFTEFFSAGFLALGLFTRLAALTIWIEMVVITFVWQWPNGYFWTNKGYEYALLWLLLCTAIMARGGGRYSLDRLIGKEF